MDHRLGNSVAGAGDVDGDGVDDVIIGAPHEDHGGMINAGAAIVYSGIDGSILHHFLGTQQWGYLGDSVASAGDVDGDGIPDLIVGTQQEYQGIGNAYVYSGADGSILYSFSGTNHQDYFGASVSAAGDVNGDGHADVIVGAPWAGANRYGAAFVYSGADGSILHSFYGNAGYDFGRSVSSMEDLDGDGYGELILGAPRESHFLDEEGAVYLISGGTGFILRTFYGATSRGMFGCSVSSLTDFDGDGISDLIIGASKSYLPGLPDAGAAFVYSGAGHPLLSVHGTQAYSNFGTSVSHAGDVDGDGFSDVIIGADKEDSWAGSAYILSGPTGGLIHSLHGGDEPDRLGHSVSSAGDVNGDGLDEVIIGAPEDTHDGKQDAGSAYVYSTAPPAFLRSNLSLLSTSQGGIIHLDMEFRQQPSGLPYRTLLSLIGTGPTVFGCEIPLTQDPYTIQSYHGAYPFRIHAFMHGVLDANRSARAHIAIPPGRQNAAIGRTLYFAVVVTPPGSLPTASTNAVSITLVP